MITKLTTAVLISVIMLIGVAGLSEAGVLDQAEQFIQTHPARVGVFYDFVGNEAHEYVAATITEDVFIEKLDISAASDFDKAIIGQVDYTIKEAKLSPYVGIGAGVDRIEGFRDLGRTIVEAHAGIKF